MSEKHQTKIQDYVLCTKLSEKCDEVWNFFAKNKKLPGAVKNRMIHMKRVLLLQKKI